MASNTNLTAEIMRAALGALAKLLDEPVTLIMGGGGAMILAHGIPLVTSDIDAIPQGRSVASIDPYVKTVALALKIAPDWLNPYFSTFTHTLPGDYGSRLIEVFNKGKLKVLALSKDDMLIMKCFAHRQKDIPHARALVKKGANVAYVEKHIETLIKRRIPGAEDALDFLDEL